MGLDDMMYDDPTLGIRKQYHDDLWMDVRPNLTIVLGVRDIEEQISYISKETGSTFDVELNSTHIDYRPILRRLSEIPNITELSIVRAPKLRFEDITVFQGISQLSSMDFFPKVNLGAFPNLVRLKAHSGTEYTGFGGASNIVQMAWYFSPNKKYDFSQWAPLKNLERLEIYHGRFTSLEFLTQFKKLNMLVLEPCLRLEYLEVLGELTDLRLLKLERAKRVRDWAILSQLPNLEELSLWNCGKVMLPEIIREKGLLEKGDFRKTDVSFSLE